MLTSEKLIPQITCPHCGQQNYIIPNLKLTGEFGDISLTFFYECDNCHYFTDIPYSVEPINNGTPLVGAIDFHGQIKFPFPPIITEGECDDNDIWDDDGVDPSELDLDYHDGEPWGKIDSEYLE